MRRANWFQASSCADFGFKPSEPIAKYAVGVLVIALKHEFDDLRGDVLVLLSRVVAASEATASEGRRTDRSGSRRDPLACYSYPRDRQSAVSAQGSGRLPFGQRHLFLRGIGSRRQGRFLATHAHDSDVGNGSQMRPESPKMPSTSCRSVRAQLQRGFTSLVIIPTDEVGDEIPQ